MTRVVYTRNNFRAAREQIAAATDRAIEKAAEELRVELQKALDMGALPIQSDTRALAESLYVQSVRGSDYDARVMAAAVAYLSDESKWVEPVRAKVTPYAYEKVHFGERVSEEEPLPQTASVARAAVATMLAYGAFWEFGHHNVFTEREEHRPWMGKRATEWAFEKMAQHFYNLLS